MLNCISRFKRIDTAIKLKHCLGIASSRARGSDASSRSKVKKFGESPANSTLVSMIRSSFEPEPVLNFAAESVDHASNSHSDLSPFEASLNGCENLTSLFKLIQPNLAGLGSDELAIVYYRIDQLFYHSLLNSSGLRPKMAREAEESAVFQELLRHTDNLVERLSTRCLLKVFETFEWIDFDPQSRQFGRLLDELTNRLAKLELADIVNCLNLLVYHTEKPSATNKLFRAGDQFRQVAKRRILSDDASLREIDTAVKCFFSFLNSPYDPDNEIIDHLVKRLQSPDIQLNFRQSVRLLKEIQKNYLLVKDKREQIRYPDQLGDLIEKCNDTIHRTFSVAGPTDQELYFYLLNLHRYTMPIEFAKQVPNFFDEGQNRLLFCLTSFLLDQFNFNDRIRLYILNMTQNYANFNIYHYELLRLVYKLFVSTPSFRAQLNISHFYNLLARFKLPFVDHQHLSQLFLTELTSSTSRSSKSTQKDLTILLTNLALNKVPNASLFENVVDQLDRLDDNRFYAQFGFRNVIKMTLARASLEFVCLEEKIQRKVGSKFDEMIDRCLPHISIRLSDKFFKLDTRLQRAGFLSNGVFLEPFGIYDRSTKNLAPLSDYVDYFYQVDQIPDRLPEHQTMYVFRFSLNGFQFFEI